LAQWGVQTSALAETGFRGSVERERDHPEITLDLPSWSANSIGIRHDCDGAVKKGFVFRRRF
jgi:hypothetical protein